MPKRPAYLLPENVIPERYDLQIRPSLESFSFEGSVSIDLEIVEPTETIILHAADLVITKKEIIVQSKNWVDYTDSEIALTTNEKQQTISLIFPEKLTPGPASLKLEFTGEINDQLCGLYRSRYSLPNGEERWMATTQCEAIDARRIFPCWDEPDKKAEIELKVIIPEELTAISNMPIEDEGFSLMGGLKKITFECTPPMSTYLFALMIGEFEWVKERTKDNILVRICTTPGKKELGNLALKQAVQILEFYTDYYSVPYPLPKADLIAIPNFAAGAMENWGADTFRETALLVDPKNSSASTEKRVVNVIDHELAHQWHGDLVTMRYWNGIWLNEGFASWLELIAALKLHPDWKPEDQFIAGDFLAALDADALKSSRPVQIEINSQNEIGEAFDAITYSKGASIIRMLENFLGPEIFRQGLSQYIKSHAYGNSEPEDLWDALEKTSGKPVRTMMDVWVGQAGYPVISVKKIRSVKNKPTVLRLSQKRFLFENNIGADAGLWSIPIGVVSEKQNERSFLLFEDKETKIRLPEKLDRENWFKLNASHTGFFRVHYEPVDLRKFKQAVMCKKLSVADRIELCDDAYSLAKAGNYSTDLFLELASWYKNEDNLHVWEVLISCLSSVERIFSKEPFAFKLRHFVKELVRPAAHRLGWNEKPDESHQNKILRGLLLETLGKSGDIATIEEARKKFELYRENHDSLNPNLRRAVYGTVAAYGNAADHQIITDLYRNSSLQEEQRRFLGALTDFSQKELLLKTLNFLISGKVRSQDVYLALRVISANPAGIDLTWNFVKENWKVFRKMYEKGKLMKYVIDVCGTLTTLEDEADVRSFFEANPVENGQRTTLQNLEKIRINAKWLTRDREITGKWIDKDFARAHKRKKIPA